MRVLNAIAAIALASSAAACASVTTGTSQTLRLDTVPSGADCTLTRNGVFVGRVNPTPGTVTVQRAKDDITVSCARQDYQAATFVNKAGLEGATLGNIILGGVVGIAIDEASGANRKYDADMRITLVPGAPGQEQVAAITAAGSPSATPPLPAPQTPTSTAAVSAPTTPIPFERATTEPAQFRCPIAGTVVRISTGQQYKFTRADGMRCGYTDETGTERQRYAILVDGFGRLARRDLDALWPLRVGNRVEFHNIDANTPNFLSKRDYEESFAVVRQEPVTVPAGRFDTFVIEWHETGFSQIYRSDAIVTLWYAPRTGYIVKSAVKVIDQDARDPLASSQYSGMNYEATEVVLATADPGPPPGSPAARGTGPSSQPDNIRNAGNPP